MDVDALIRDLVDGDQHRGGLRCRRLLAVEPAAFDRLSLDVERLRRTLPPSRASDPGHVTRWAGPSGEVLTWSLVNRSGRTDDFSSDHNLSCRGKWFFHEALAPTLSRLLADLPHVVNCRVNMLGPGAALACHEEHVPFHTATGTVGARVRFHLPITTNDDAELVLDGSVYHLEAGYVHLINQGCVHTAWNRGSSERVHLVWDALLTGELVTFLGDPSRHGSSMLRPVSGPDDTPRRSERMAPHRRLPPLVPASQVDQTSLCRPQ